MDYSLADVVRMTGGKRRSVHLWAESGAILACCLNGLARRQVGIGELIRIGRGLRTFLNRGKFRAEIEESISGTEPGEYYLVVIWPEEKDPYVLLLDESEISPEIGN